MFAASNAINIPGTSTSYSNGEEIHPHSSGLARMLANSPLDHGFHIDGAGRAPGLGFAEKQSRFANVARDLAAKYQMGEIHTLRPQQVPAHQAEVEGSPPAFLTFAYKLFAEHRQAQADASTPAPQNDFLVELYADLKGEPESVKAPHHKAPQSRALLLTNHALFEAQTENY